MAEPHLTLLHSPEFPQVFAAAIDRQIDRVKVAPIATAYQQLVVAHLVLVNSTYAAIAKLNMGEAEQAQTILLGAIADIERGN
jgi:hypothetical protein